MATNQYLSPFDLNLKSFRTGVAYNNNLPLIVDYPITGPVQIPNYNSLTITADTFNLDSTLGTYGGYIIPVTLN